MEKNQPVQYDEVKNQYNAIATNYNQEVKGASFYDKLVNPTIRRMLGDVKGKVQKGWVLYFF